jgi:uncharacterized membrane protein YphA (DoxX/SURF4 family)
LLRVAVGVSAIVQGANYIRSAAFFTGVAEIASGTLLVIGFLTPIASVLAAISCAAVAFSRVSLPAVKFFEASWTIVAVALILLGPGAISIDSQLFGRRTIIIPSRR